MPLAVYRKEMCYFDRLCLKIFVLCIVLNLPNYFKFLFLSRLCYKYKDKSSDGIFYKMLLDNLKVAVLSGDLNGISSHISKEKQQREEKRQTELSKRYYYYRQFSVQCKEKICIERRLSDRLRIHAVFLMVSAVLG